MPAAVAEVADILLGRTSGCVELASVLEDFAPSLGVSRGESLNWWILCGMEPELELFTYGFSMKMNGGLKFLILFSFRKLDKFALTLVTSIW